jgi:hypothetical protein
MTGYSWECDKAYLACVHRLDVLHLIVPYVHEHVKQAVTRRPPQWRVITAARLQLIKLQCIAGQGEAPL